MTMHSPRPAGNADDAPKKLFDLPAERLVLTGFRCCLAGYQHGSIECWEVAWNEFSRELGTTGARRVFGDVLFWARAVRGASRRRIDCYPYCCRQVCRDECMALSVISALQHDQPDLARIATYHLTQADRSDEVTAAAASADALAASLMDEGRILMPVTADVITSIADHRAGAGGTAASMH